MTVFTTYILLTQVEEGLLLPFSYGKGTEGVGTPSTLLSDLMELLKGLNKSPFKGSAGDLEDKALPGMVWTQDQIIATR